MHFGEMKFKQRPREEQAEADGTAGNWNAIGHDYMSCNQSVNQWIEAFIAHPGVQTANKVPRGIVVLGQSLQLSPVVSRFFSPLSSRSYLVVLLLSAGLRRVRPFHLERLCRISSSISITRSLLLVSNHWTPRILHRELLTKICIRFVVVHCGPPCLFSLKVEQTFDISHLNWHFQHWHFRISSRQNVNDEVQNNKCRCLGKQTLRIKNKVYSWHGEI